MSPVYIPIPSCQSRKGKTNEGFSTGQFKERLHREYLDDQNAMHRFCEACLNVFLKDGSQKSLTNDSHLLHSSWWYLLDFLVVQLNFQSIEDFVL